MSSSRNDFIVFAVSRLRQHGQLVVPSKLPALKKTGDIFKYNHHPHGNYTRFTQRA